MAIATTHKNPGNFKNDPKRASEAGRKGGSVSQKPAKDSKDGK